MKQTDIILLKTAIFLLTLIILLQTYRHFQAYSSLTTDVDNYTIVEFRTKIYPLDNIVFLKNGHVQGALKPGSDNIRIILRQGDVIEIDATSNSQTHILNIGYTKESPNITLPKTIIIEKGLYRFPPFNKKTL